MKLRRLVFVAVHPPGEQIEKHPQEVKVQTGHVGDLEYGANSEEKTTTTNIIRKLTTNNKTTNNKTTTSTPFRCKVCCRGDDVILCLHQDRDLAAAGGLEDPGQQLHRVLQDVGRAHVDLCHHHKHGNTQRQGKSKML